jgi:IPT/TIG domain
VVVPGDVLALAYAALVREQSGLEVKAMNMTSRTRLISGLCITVWLAACGGGGGSDDPAASTPPPSGNNPPGANPPPNNPPPSSGAPAFSLSTAAVNFVTPNRNATPLAQKITATVTGNVSGTLYILVQVTGPAVRSVSNITITGSTSGEATVFPAMAGTLGVGTHTSTITVTACTNDPTCATGQLSGSPRTVNVTYTVQSAMQGELIAPRVVTSGEPGEVVIRGRGFSQVTDVRFGSTAASSVSVVNDTEIRAVYPALSAGNYPVALNSGAVSFSGTLVAVDKPNYAAATLTYPSPPTAIGGILYDAQRSALFLAARYSQSGNNQLIRYSFNSGAWSAPVSTTVPGINDVVLSPSGTSLLAVTDTAVTEVDPAGLTLGAVHAPTADQIGFTAFLRHLAIANDGYGILTTDLNGSGMTNLLLYSTSSHAFYLADSRLSRADPAASGDRSTVVVAQSGITPEPPVDIYDASSQLYSSTQALFSRNRNPQFGRTTVNRTGTRIVLPSFTTQVLDQNYQLLGTLPGTTRAAVLAPDGGRVHTLDSSGELRSYDLTAAPVGGVFPQVGTGVVVGINGSNGIVAMAISPDGGSLFIADTTKALVQPAPP